MDGMLYEEFIKGTKAIESKQTFEQYELLQKIYMDCENITKEDIYKIWKTTYGKQQKIDSERIIKEIRTMSEYCTPDTACTPEQAYTRRLLFQTGASLVETDDFQAGYNAEITTPNGITYRLEEYDTINGHRQMRLLIKFEGKTYGTALIYSFGNLKIHATPNNLPKIA